MHTHIQCIPAYNVYPHAMYTHMQCIPTCNVYSHTYFGYIIICKTATQVCVDNYKHILSIESYELNLVGFFYGVLCRPPNKYL